MHCVWKNSKALFQYALLFIMIAYWPAWLIGQGVSRILILAMLFLWFAYKKKIYVSREMILILLGLLFSYFLSMIFGGINILIDIGKILSITICFLFCGLMRQETFIERYKNLLFFITCYSLITFALFYLAPSIFDHLPMIEGTAPVANAFFSLIPVTMKEYFRNFGCWQEPGMYCVYLSVAFVFELFCTDEVKLKRILIIILAYITTFSTSGYVVGAVLLITFGARLVLDKKEMTKRSRRIYMIWLLIAVVGILYSYFFGFLSQKNYVFLKLQSAGRNIKSTSWRLRAIRIAINLIKQYFPFGSGSEITAEYLIEGTILTATPLNWFAFYGFLFGLIMNLGIIFFSKKVGKHLIVSLGIWIALIGVTMAQEMSCTYLMLILVFYSLNMKK
ncbi:MAG: O-antigen ligase family protein [Hungatella sp.]|nr:O-antigen ligase family protein [Hungatella sp.]